MALAVLLVAITLVTITVGVVGISRIAKGRPALKSYEELPKPSAKEAENMRLAALHARTRLKTDLETDSDTHFAESHVRARVGEVKRDDVAQDAPLLVRMLGRIGQLLIQLTGISLLTGKTPDPITMGNTAKPTLAVRDLTTSTTHPAEVDVLRDSKATATTTETQWSEDESSEKTDAEDDGLEQKKPTPMAPLEGFIVDGVQFYATVAKLSISTASNVIDIGVFRASTIIMRERRKALEDASILAIEQQYPDIMCLPAHANVRYAGPAVMKQHTASLSVASSSDLSSGRVSSPTSRAQLTSSFLKAA